jgi:PAS domain S-box-containing protein
MAANRKTIVPYVFARWHTPRKQGRSKRGAGHLWVPLVTIAAIVLSHPIAAAPTKEVRRILILNEVNVSYPVIPIINQKIQTALYNPLYRLEFYFEYLDPLLFPDPATQQEFRDFYLRKYQNRKPDVIITVGSTALKFMEEVHQRAFPGVPIVFCLPHGIAPGAPTLDSDFTGVENDMESAETLAIALKLQPGTEYVVVVNGGVSDWDKQELAVVKQQLKGFTDRVDITYMTALAVPELLERLKHLPRHTLVLFTSLGKDAEGTLFTSREIGPLVTASANAPVFSLFDVFLNHGEVGGYLSDMGEQGRVAGGLALRILRGEKPQDIPRVPGVNTYMFDWRAIKRWGLKETEIPAGSIVINRQYTIWQLYKWYIVSGICLIIFQALMIFGLLWQRAGRLKSEKAVRESEGRFRLVANTAPVLIWMSGPDKLRTYFNQPWLEFTGRSIEAELGAGWAEGAHPEDQKNCLDAYNSAFDQRRPFKMQYRLRRNDGEYRWISDIGVARFNPDRSFAGYIGSCIDVTERKMAEEALASLSGRLIDAQEEERKRIAREIHDDYTQRLAMLAMEVEELADQVGDSPVEAGPIFHRIWNQIGELGSDLHSLSHSLHSSTLESLGLVAGIKAFCKEFAEQQEIQVEFAHENVPRGVPADAALCLFRVTQEGLRNIKRHSGANKAEVRLQASGKALHLSIADRGRGFDVNNHSPLDGIGIRSMEERLRSQGGKLEISSQPMEGTRINAWLPLRVASHRVA